VPEKKKILVIQNIHQEGINLLKGNSSYEFEIFDEINEDLKQKIVDCDAISIRTAKLPNEIISSAKKLQVISRHGVGYDNIDLKSTKEIGATLTITATANAVAVAEHVIFMLLNISKRKEELLSIHTDNWNDLMNNTISQTAMGMTPQQIRNSNVSDDGFISGAY